MKTAAVSLSLAILLGQSNAMGSIVFTADGLGGLELTGRMEGEPIWITNPLKKIEPSSNAGRTYSVFGRDPVVVIQAAPEVRTIAGKQELVTAYARYGETFIDC